MEMHINFVRGTAVGSSFPPENKKRKKKKCRAVNTKRKFNIPSNLTRD